MRWNKWLDVVNRVAGIIHAPGKRGREWSGPGVRTCHWRRAFTWIFVYPSCRGFDGLGRYRRISMNCAISVRLKNILLFIRIGHAGDLGPRSIQQVMAPAGAPTEPGNAKDSGLIQWFRASNASTDPQNVPPNQAHSCIRINIPSGSSNLVNLALTVICLSTVVQGANTLPKGSKINVLDFIGVDLKSRIKTTLAVPWSAGLAHSESWAQLKQYKPLTVPDGQAPCLKVSTERGGPSNGHINQRVINLVGRQVI